MIFTWDPKKAKANYKKHKVSFTEATTSFSDPYAIFEPDKDHNERAVLIGYSVEQHLLIVVHIEILGEEDNGEDITRIISARKADPKERRRYEEGDKK